MTPFKVLYVATAIDPFLSIPPLSTHVKSLADHIAISPEYETRLLIPRFGVIKERSNNIHETIRLSGINIPMGKDRISLVVKVPSVRGVKLPIYFIDNEDLFQRKGIFTDKKGTFYTDNDIRALFFCKSALAIVEKLGWIPHIIHCHGWITSFIPIYIKKAYTESHPLYHIQSIYTLYDEPFQQTFSQEMLKHARYKQLKISDLEDICPEKIGFQSLTNLAITYADKVTRTFDSPQDAASWQNISYEKAEYLSPDAASQEAYVQSYQALHLQSKQ